jgi:hypothetical protein
MDEVEVLNGTLRAGDRVAVAVGARNAGLRVGTVLEIMPGIAGYNQRDGGARVRVLVDKATDMTGQHYNKVTQTWVFLPFTRVYDTPEAMVKLGALQDAL